MSVSHSGHMYAMMLASSSLCPASGLVEQFGGLSQVRLRYWRNSEWVKLFYPVIETIWCEHSIKTFSAVLSNGVTLFDSFFRYNLHVTSGEYSLAFRLHVDLSNCKSFSISVEYFLGADMIWEFWEKCSTVKRSSHTTVRHLFAYTLISGLIYEELSWNGGFDACYREIQHHCSTSPGGNTIQVKQKNNCENVYRGEEHWKTVNQSGNSTNFLKNEWEKLAFLSGP